MTQYSERQQKMLALFDKHVNAEVEGDLDTTMATMTDAPHLVNVANGLGGSDYAGVKKFYNDHLVGKFFPPDVQMIPISKTIDENQIVDELVLSFTHTMIMSWMLPGVPPTGKKVKVALAVIVGFEGGKVSHEHIYWDQASVLVQVGLLKPDGLPVVGSEGARKVLDLSSK